MTPNIQLQKYIDSVLMMEFKILDLNVAGKEEERLIR